MGSLAMIPRTQSGTTMIEVLITMVILVIGLLGLAGLQARLHSSEMEAYQRTQAVILVNDMASRINANRNNAANYVSSSYVGSGMTCPSVSGNRQQMDSAEWCNALQGAAETSSGSSVGAMVGGRGCVDLLSDGSYLITVAWQGLTPITAPPANVTCAKDLYNNASTSCINDLCRRVVTTIVRIASLS